MTTPIPKKIADQIERMADAFESIDGLLFRLGQQGLQHASLASVDELMALKQTAHNAGLATIARDLEALSLYLSRYVGRDPLFEMRRFSQTLNRIWLLNRKARALREAGALPADMVPVIGRARRTFELVEAPLIFQALGAQGWVTDSGFVGITLYCHVAEQPMLQVVTARPTMYFGQDPRRLRNTPPNDALAHTLSSLSHGGWQVSQAKLSSDRRLSLHKDCVIEAAPYTGVRAYADYEVESWMAIVERLQLAALHPTEAGEQTMVCVRPARWGSLETDSKRARVTGILWDEAGAELEVEVALTTGNNWLIDSLEMLFNGRKLPRRSSLGRPDALFGRAWVADGRLRFLPFTGLYSRAVRLAGQGEKVHELHLGLEG